jgi:hypothetical protein
MTPGDWLDLSPSEKAVRGRELVARRLEGHGGRVIQDARPPGSPLRVRGRTRECELFVSTQKVGGYAFWTKRRLEPAGDRYVAIVLLSEGEAPELFLIPTLDFRHAAKPLTDRDFVGLKSEPEYGVELTAASIARLQPYAWADREPELLR